MNKESNGILGSFSLRKFIAVCFKYWYIFLITILPCVFVAGLLTVVRTPKSEVLAQLMLKDESGGSSMFMAGQIARSFSLGDMFGGSSSTDNETYVIKSHTVFLHTAQELNLNVSCFTKRFGLLWGIEYTKAPLTLRAQPGVADTITKTLVFKLKRDKNDNFNVDVTIKNKSIAKVSDKPLPLTINTPYGDFVLDKTEYFAACSASKFKFTFCSYDAAASSYEKIVKVYVPDRKSDFIDISFISGDPVFGKRLVSAIIANYEALANEYKDERSMQSLKLVDDRLESLETELQQSESDIEKFKLSNNLTDVVTDAQYILTKSGTVETSLLEAQTNYEVIKLTKDFISNPSNNYSLIPELYVSASASAGENNTMISNYNQLILERMRLLASATGNNSMVKQIDQQIDALRANIITSVNRAYENASVVLRDLKNENLKNQNRLGELPTIERKYIVLKRDNMLQEQIYLFLLQQREELQMSLNSRSFPAQVIDKPYVLVDSPGLSRMMTIAVGLFIGFIIAVIYILMKKMSKYPISSRSEFKSTVEAPVMQDLAIDKSSGNKFALALSDVNAEPFRMLRSDVQFALNSFGGKVIVVTSINDNEGKTYVATNLAGSLALTGKKVALVDLSLRDPKVASNLGIKERRPIFTEYVNKQIDNIPGNIVAVDQNSILNVVATQTADSNPSDMVASSRFAQLISDLSAENDYVVIDGSRIKDYCDIYYLTDVADMTLIVSRAGIITSDDISMINGLYADGRLKRIAVIDNAFKY